MSQKPHKKTSVLWLFGRHPVEMALQNPRRKIEEIVLAKEVQNSIQIPPSIPVRKVSRAQLDELAAGALHQGVAARTAPLAPVAFETVLAQTESQKKSVIVMLDQVTDPHNIGAIARSAAAFGAAAVVVPDAGVPEESGVMAKSASGALEIVPLVRVTNLSRAMEMAKKAGFWCVGLDGYAQKSIMDNALPDKCVLVMGSEGSGLRRLTAQNCDYTVKLPINPAMESLNVSNACAIALYEWNRPR